MLNMMLKHEILKGIQDYVKIDEPGSYKLMKSHIKGASARSFHHRVQDIFKIKRCSHLIKWELLFTVLYNIQHKRDKMCYRTLQYV